MRRAIFGAGKNGEILYAAAKNNDIQIDFFVDDFSSRKKHCGIPVFRSEEIDPSTTEIYVSLFQSSAGGLCSDQLKNDLEGRGFNAVYSFEETFRKWSGVGNTFAETSYHWMRKDPSLMLDRNKLNFFASLLADEKSRALLQLIISFRETYAAEHYPMPENTIQYFPDDLPLYSKIDELRFIDGGAFIGDSIANAVETFNRLRKPVNSIVSFEPDEINRRSLRHEIAKQKERTPTTFFALYPCALWSDYDVLSFHHAEQGSGALVSTEFGDRQVLGVSVDDTLFSMAPNCIKLDVEGAEAAVLQGAAETIRACRPALAVCLYHRPQDLWELPLQIHELYAGYDMYLRLYGHMGIELVLYCIPKSSVR